MTLAIHCLLLTIIFAQIDESLSKSVLEFVRGILRGTFEVHSTLYYFRNNSEFSEIVDASLLSGTLMRPLMLMDPAKISFDEDRKNSKDGYILSGYNKQFLIDIFSKRVGNFEFDTRHRVLIVFEERRREINDLLKDNVIIKAGQTSALDIFVAYFENNTDAIKVISLYKNQILGSYNNGSYKINYSIRNYTKTTIEPFLGGKPLRISAFDCPPYFYYNNNGEIDGFEHRMLQEIFKDKYDLSFTLHPTEVLNMSMYRYVARKVGKNQADLASCAQWRIVNLNVSGVDTTTPYLQECVTFLVPKSREQSGTLFILQALNTVYWVLILISAFAICNILYLISLQSTRSKYSNFTTCLLDTIRIYAMGSLPHFLTLQGTLRKLLIIHWYFSCLLLYTIYSAGYTSILASPKTTKAINTLQDIWDQKISWGIVDTVVKNMLATSHRPILQKIATLYEYIPTPEVRNKRFYTDKHGMYARQLPMRYILDTEHFDNYGKTTLKVLNYECILSYDVGYVVHKNSPFLTIVNSGIERMIENGLFDAWYKLIKSERNMTYTENFYETSIVDKSSKQLRLMKMQGAFYLLFIGYIFSAIVFIFEILKT